MGSVVARQLVAMQHQVTVFHRGHTSVNLPASVNHVLGDRHWERNKKVAIDVLQ